MKKLPAWLNASLVRWCRGPEHPMKQRLIRYVTRLTGWRLQIAYAGAGKITVDPTDEVQNAILLRGAYEPEVWDALRVHASGAEVLWDVGSNVGGIALLAARSGKVRAVHAFEPHPQTYALLLQHVLLNSDVPIPLVAHNVALGSREEVLHMGSGPVGNTGGASFAFGPDAKGFDVPCTTVDEIVRRGAAPPPDLLKLDVEGWEPEVLRGAINTFARHLPKAIVFEAPAFSDGSPKSMEAFQLLEAYGFTSQHIPRPDGAIHGNENYLATRAVASAN